MGTNWKEWENWVAAAFAISAGLIVLVVIGKYFDLKGSDWAAWVQAIGSIGAIWAAFSVSNYQYKRQRELDRAIAELEIDGLLQSFRSEIEAFSLGFMSEVKLYIEDRARGGIPRAYRFPIPEKSSLIYEANVAKLGRINADIRRQIVATYNELFNLIHYAKLVNAISEEDRAAGYAKYENETTRTQTVYRNALEASYLKLEKCINRLLEIVQIDSAPIKVMTSDAVVNNRLVA